MNNNDIGIMPIECTEASELSPSTSPNGTNTQSTMEALAEELNSEPLRPSPVTS